MFRPERFLQGKLEQVKCWTQGMWYSQVQISEFVVLV